MALIDKFTYYDILANFIPAFFLIWALVVLGPFSKESLPISLTGNTIIDPLLLISVGYVIGQVIQFMSKYVIEEPVKHLFWKGQFFSQIYLIPAYKLCSMQALPNYILRAENDLGFSENELSVLQEEDVISNDAKKKIAMNLCQEIYRRIKAKTPDDSKAERQNMFYGFFRNLAAVSLILVLVNSTELFAIELGYVEKSVEILHLISLKIILSILMMCIFIARTKQRGELHVKEIFWRTD